LAETGIIGMAGLLMFFIIGYRFLRQYGLGFTLFPWCLGVITATFPLNTHMAFYGSFWSSLIWWQLLMIFIGAATEMRRKSAFEDFSSGSIVTKW